MENNRPKKKNAGLTALIALLLVVTTIASCIGIYAWARYTKSQDGSATAAVAKWSFNVRLKKGDSSVSLASEAIDLSTTIDHVADGKIAPGTSGTFDIEIDTTGTEVDMQYDVTISLANCPRNITFSRKTGTNEGQDVFTPISAGGTSNSQDLTRTGITFSEYVTKGNNGVHVERIKWDWPYSDANDANYDDRDNDDEDAINASQSKKVTMNITVTGTEQLENENSVQGLAKSGAIQRFDIITNYSPTGTINTSDLNVRGASIIGNTKVAALNGASIDGTIDAANATDWVVLDVNQETGEVLIIPRTINNPALVLYGIDGYNNAIDAIESVASIYGNSPYAQSVQSMNIELVNRLERKSLSNVQEKSATTASFSTNYTLDENYNIQAESGTITIPESMARYQYDLSVTSGCNCWLASRFVNLYDSHCSFGVRTLNGDILYTSGLFTEYLKGGYIVLDSYYAEEGQGNQVLPVVTLKSDVLMDMGDPFYTETATATTATQQVTEFVHHSWTLR